MIAWIAIRFIRPVLDVYGRLKELAGIDDEVTSPLIKTVGIGILTQITVSICEDAGDKSICKVVEFAGGIMAVYVGLPLLSAVITLLEELGR